MSESEPRARRGGTSPAFSLLPERGVEDGDEEGDERWIGYLGGEEVVSDVREEEEEEEERDVA